MEHQILRLEIPMDQRGGKPMEKLQQIPDLTGNIQRFHLFQNTAFSDTLF